MSNKIKIKEVSYSCFLNCFVLRKNETDETIIAPIKNYSIGGILNNADNSAIFLGNGSGFAFQLLSKYFDFDSISADVTANILKKYEKLINLLEQYKDRLPLIDKPPYKDFPVAQLYNGDYYNDLLSQKIICENKEYRAKILQSEPKEIFENSYKTVIYDEFEDIFSVKESILTEKQAKKLCEIDNVLDFLYDEWLANSIIPSTREDLYCSLLEAVSS